MKINKAIGIIAEKDCESRIVNCNNLFLYYAGINSKNNILGLTDYNFPWQEHADLYRQHELDALSGNNYSTIIPLKDCNNNDLLFLHTKTQKSDTKGQGTGIACHALEIINPDAYRLFHFLKMTSLPETKQYCINHQSINTNLSKR